LKTSSSVDYHTAVTSQWKCNHTALRKPASEDCAKYNIIAGFKGLGIYLRN
jgi:hypothetical protein